MGGILSKITGVDLTDDDGNALDIPGMVNTLGRIADALDELLDIERRRAEAEGLY